MNIYYFNITVLRNRNVFGEVVKTLDDARAEKISRLRITADKLRSAGAGILINFIKEKYNIAGDVKVDKFGKPYFEDTDIHFNISHSGCYVIAAVSDEDIGIDIQKIKSDKHRIAEKNFLPSECAYINEIEDEKINQQRFCEIWTIKEAYLKNIGIGLRKPLNSFEIDFSEDAPQIVGKKEYKFVQLKFDEKYIVTVCADQSDEIFDVEEVLVV